MDYKGLFDTVGTVHKITGKSRIKLFFDIVYCGLRYGAGYKDYLLCEWYLLTKEQRATYVTRGINNTITRLCNDPEYYFLFDNKNEFYSKFGKFIKREWHYIPKTSEEEFEKFMSTRDVIIAKPSNESCGNGVEKIRKTDFESVEKLFDYLRNKGSAIAEDVIQQHELINAINPGSVNTLRIVTIYRDGESHVIYAFIRIGNGDRPVDNINAGGMCAPIDIDTGIITHVGYDKDRITYKTHPKTGCPIEGYQIPMWKEAVDMCLEAAKVVPEMGYVGWDIAITPDGPVMVEGNNLPGHDILQMPPHVPDRIGMLPRFKMFVKGL
ncbi:MAG: sugar-transfer associated ATP-grasp domain-containing protein [Clostridia bacterium]|nr:sugar-transfer associated ATP-grasp domain-containing protein [Clostridia bacterium]